MIAYFLGISNPENPFFQSLTKFQQVFISPDSLKKISYNRSIDVEVYGAVIEYENKEAKPGHYLI